MVTKLNKMSIIIHVKYIFVNCFVYKIIDINVLFILQFFFLNSEMFFETLNKWMQSVPYFYTCKFNKMAFPWRYPHKPIHAHRYVYIVNYTRMKVYTNCALKLFYFGRVLPSHLGT